jgi:uncharacterized membrane protein YadS
MWTLARKFVLTVLPELLKPVRVLWNEIIGFFFIVIAVFALGSTIRNFSSFNGSPGELFILVLSCFFFVMMAVYGVYSFFRARRISRS